MRLDVSPQAEALERTETNNLGDLFFFFSGSVEEDKERIHGV